MMYLVVMVEDIDSQKNDQENLRKSEARFKAMFDNTSVGVAIMSLERRVLDLNHAAELIIGRTKAELKDLDPAVLSHPDDVTVGQQEFGEMILGSDPGFPWRSGMFSKTMIIFGHGLLIRALLMAVKTHNI